MNWNQIIIEEDISEEFLKEHIHYVDWKHLIYNKELSTSFIKTFDSYLDWNDIAFAQILSEEIIETYSDRLDWHYISMYQPLSARFILQHWGNIHFAVLRKNERVQLNERDWEHLRSLNDEYLSMRLLTLKDLHEQHEQSKERVCWRSILKKFIIPEQTLREYAHLSEYYWHFIVQFQVLSEEFIREFYHEMIPELILRNQNISESYIEEIVEKETTINLWDLISQYQKLSFPFVKKHIQDILLRKCKKNKHLSFTKEQWKELEQLKK